jgi:hypothetical protein
VFIVHQSDELNIRIRQKEVPCVQTRAWKFAIALFVQAILFHIHQNHMKGDNTRKE